MKEKIVQKIKSMIPKAQAIILHGSQANENAHKHSDWDFVVLVKEYTENIPDYFDFGGSKVDLEIVMEINDSFINHWAGNLLDALVCYEIDGSGINLLKKVKERLGVGYPEEWSTKERQQSRKYFLEGKIGGMIDQRSNPEIYIKYHSIFYLRVINAWYHVKHCEYSKNLYYALPEISERDPEFRKMIQ